jgi:hypothetical protein
MPQSDIKSAGLSWELAIWGGDWVRDGLEETARPANQSRYIAVAFADNDK